MDTRSIILDIAMNLNRVGNWAADDYLGKKERIKHFLKGTDDYVNSIDQSSLKKEFVQTFNYFKNNYKLLKIEIATDRLNPILWAEKAMTLGNILTHRSKLLT